MYQSKRWKIEDDLNKTGLHRTLVFFNLNNDVNIHLPIVSRFKGKLVETIEDAGTKFDYSISPKIRQILLHWSYELVKSDLLQLC